MGCGHSRIVDSLTGVQRNPPFAASQEFLSSSPDRSLPLLVQFCHLSVPEARKLSFDRGCQFSWLAGYPLLKVSRAKARRKIQLHGHEKKLK